MARKRRGRAIDGIVLLDKPMGISSNHALQRVKRLFDAQKAGHTGSLDPLATGMLPVCLGFATRVSGLLLDSDKAYRTRAQLGVITDSGDAEGEVLERREVPPIRREELLTVIQQFIGQIDQVPPMYSALKINGQRLYKLAREGVEVERKARTITIHSIELLAFTADSFELQVDCSKGTYIRTLVEDIGAALGCGAHVSMLRRTKVGPFEQQPMYTLEQLETLAEDGQLDDVLLPTDTAIADWPRIELDPDSAFYLCQGQAVLAPGAPTNGWVRLYKDDEQFLGLGEILDDGRVAPRRLAVTI